MRKSSRRSDQRSPPRATGPNRRCTPSKRGAYTKISYRGRGAGSSGIARGSSLNATYDFGRPPLRWKNEVRRVAWISVRYARMIRSWSRLATSSRRWPISVTSSLPRSARSSSVRLVGENRVSKSATSSSAISGLATRVVSIDDCE